jgi:acyl carrier protein
MPELSITERVIQTIAKTQHISPDTIQPQNSFAELKIDSLDGLQIMFALEEEFGVSIPDDEVKKLTSVAEAIAGIEKLLAAKV